MLRSATSTAANYRATCRARSLKEFYSKISIVVEEADESCFWLEILEESEILPRQKLKLIYQEGKEILLMMAKARKTVGIQLSK